MRKRTAVSLAAALVVVTVLVLAFVISRQRVRRHRLFREAETTAKAPEKVPPVEQWTATFSTLGAADLAELLEWIEGQHQGLYERYALAYLHARALIETNDIDEAARKLAPFLVAVSPFRDLALYHRSELAVAGEEEAAASRLRQELIFDHPDSPYRQEAIEEEADQLSAASDTARLIEFVRRVSPSVDTQTRRDLNARLVEAHVRTGNTTEALSSGIRLLEGETGDDAADRVSRALDRPELVRVLPADHRALLGEALRSHRHFDRAIALLSSVLRGMPPSRKRDELQFALGRSYFGSEQYGAAQRVYIRGANATSDARAKATFLFHASRAAQLQGDDRAAERLMTAAIAVKGTFPATTAALTQRLRTRIKQKRWADAASDLQLLRRIAGNQRAFAEGSLAYALGLLAKGDPDGAVRTLDTVPRSLLDPHDLAEFAYWRARALEQSDPRGAFRNYLLVLRARVPTHFAYFTRERLDAPAMAPKLAQELAIREAQAKNLISAKRWALAKEVETDRILLSSQGRATELERLAEIYRQLSDYRSILELKPVSLPSFPLDETSDRVVLLMAMGLYDEAVNEIEKRYALRPPRSALTRALALNRGNAARESIHAVEVLMRSVPDDYVPDLLPLLIRHLLYPRYFYSFIIADADRFETDPVLVLSIMREESRFNPRAKSAAAARGLLQFIITTAREIGRNIGLVEVQPEDLYDPRVIISLGAKYVGTLSEDFEGNRYKTAAAYNAGPKQVALWSRLAPADGDDFFLSAINFDETRHYVRKVMNSYKRYHEIYGTGGPAGGITIEP